jgi:hypothetical protein
MKKLKPWTGCTYSVTIGISLGDHNKWVPVSKLERTAGRDDLIKVKKPKKFGVLDPTFLAYPRRKTVENTLRTVEWERQTEPLGKYTVLEFNPVSKTKKR